MYKIPTILPLPLDFRLKTFNIEVLKLHQKLHHLVQCSPVPHERTAQYLSFEWSHIRVSSTKRKKLPHLVQHNKQYHMKVMLISFDFTVPTLEVSYANLKLQASCIQHKKQHHVKVLLNCHKTKRSTPQLSTCLRLHSLPRILRQVSKAKTVTNVFAHFLADVSFSSHCTVSFHEARL